MNPPAVTSRYTGSNRGGLLTGPTEPTKHSLPETHHLTLELIHGKLDEDKMRIGRFAQDAQRKVQEAAEEMEARYSANLQTLLRQGLGIEVAPGSLLTGSLEDHSITVRPPGPTEPTDDA